MRKWRIHRRTGKTLGGLAEAIDPVTAGWINYYGRFHKSALYAVFGHLDQYLVRRAGRKYKRLRSSKRKAWAWLKGVKAREPELFAHWRLLGSMAGR